MLALSASLRPKYGTPYLFTSANLKHTLPSDLILRRTTLFHPNLPPSGPCNAPWFSSETLALYKSLTYLLTCPRVVRVTGNPGKPKWLHFTPVSAFHCWLRFDSKRFTKHTTTTTTIVTIYVYTLIFLFIYLDSASNSYFSQWQSQRGAGLLIFNLINARCTTALASAKRCLAIACHLSVCLSVRL